jgi:hypothetical protein
MKPFPWQEPLVGAIVTSLQKNRMFISGFPTGSGKTILALAAAKQLADKHLVFAPKVSLTQWRRTAEAMGCSDQLIGVMNPEKVPIGKCPFFTEICVNGYKQKLWRLPPNCIVTWDEPHRSASGEDSATADALARLKAAQGVKLHAMSATLADSPRQLRALAWWAGLHEWHNASFREWCRKHGCIYEKVKSFDPKVNLVRERWMFNFTKDKAEAMAHMADVRREFGGMFMSMKAEDIPDFPTEDISTELIDLDKRDRDEIDEAYASMSERMKTKGASILAENGRERERIEFVMAEAAAELAAYYVADGSSIVIFFNFTEPRLRFEEAYKRLAKKYELVEEIASVYGGQTDKERQAGIDAFQANEIHCESVMAAAGGAALSLQDVLGTRPRTSLILPGWDAKAIKQCLGRIRRCGGGHATQKFLFAAGTVQERVAARMQLKLQNLDAFNFAEILEKEGEDAVLH